MSYRTRGHMFLSEAVTWTQLTALLKLHWSGKHWGRQACHSSAGDCDPICGTSAGERSQCNCSRPPTTQQRAGHRSAEGGVHTHPHLAARGCRGEPCTWLHSQAAGPVTPILHFCSSDSDFQHLPLVFWEFPSPTTLSICSWRLSTFLY